MFLPISKEDLLERGIDYLDFIVVSGDAYIDHPSFGHALIARILEAEGFNVGIIAQPMCDGDYKKLPPPRYAYLVTSGVVDSMVNNYTSSKTKRKRDEYSEGGDVGKRPDRALTVYSRKLKFLFPEIPVIIGGLEASLRRLAHYDYWSDSVMPSVLVDTNADLLVYGMGEKPLLDLANSVKKGIPVNKIREIRGTAYLVAHENMSNDVKSSLEGKGSYMLLNSFDRVRNDKKIYHKAFFAAEGCEIGLIQKQNYTDYVVINPPQEPLAESDMDSVYALPFERKTHPMYAHGVPAIEEVEFSITAHRGCFGHCSFCALTYHQGRHIIKRSADSIVKEAEMLIKKEGFKGYIHDIGGPTANFHGNSCKKGGGCKNKDCIGFKACDNLKVDHSDYFSVLRKVRSLAGVKKVFIRSGIRFDYLMMDKNASSFIEELLTHHVSGQLKVAPEHVSDDVLKYMNKPPHKIYASFASRFKESNKKLNKEQYLVPYFISGHPGCTLSDAIKLYEYLDSIGYMPLQVQDFYPTPSTLSTTMYYTELDKEGKPLYVAKLSEEKAMQRALMQYRLPINRELILSAFDKEGRKDLKMKFLNKVKKQREKN